MGNNGNVFDVIYDTGSANLWIDSAQCKDDGCVNHKQYNGANSANYKKLGLELDVQFGTGEL
jgi:cathepsin D